MSNVRPHLNQFIQAKAREVIERVYGSVVHGAPSQEQQRELSDWLCNLARSPVWESPQYAAASIGEELVYEHAISTNEGPSLYLVSDGASVSSKPHRHETWAVIVGIRGYEVNRLYRRQAGSQKAVVPTSQIEVGPMSVLALHEQDIHSTEVRGSSATFHLHLYGRPLHVLPSFASRCYAVAGEV